MFICFFWSTAQSDLGKQESVYFQCCLQLFSSNWEYSDLYHLLPSTDPNHKGRGKAEMFPLELSLAAVSLAEGKEGLLWLRMPKFWSSHPSHIRQSLEKIKRNELKFVYKYISSNGAGPLSQGPLNLRECTGQFDTAIWQQVDWDFLHMFVSCFR